MGERKTSCGVQGRCEGARIPPASGSSVLQSALDLLPEAIGAMGLAHLSAVLVRSLVSVQEWPWPAGD